MFYIVFKGLDTDKQRAEVQVRHIAEIRGCFPRAVLKGTRRHPLSPTGSGPRRRHPIKAKDVANQMSTNGSPKSTITVMKQHNNDKYECTNDSASK